MTRIAPVNLAYNPKTLWFDARDLEPGRHDFVVVLTARGLELGHMAGAVFEATEEDVAKLKSPLKPVKRIATEDDIAQGEEMERLGKEALPIFREMAAETNEDMRPISVEYLLEGDKAVFYFEAEDRVDFRDLVRNLAAHFHVRVDMRQIGVRDEARMVGGYGHCGQQLCCCRMGGEFCPVSIRMAKEQDLSLNPQKISGVCGRLMCCLRYEYDTYKEFKSGAPKQNAVISTPDGPAKVTGLDVPREMVLLRTEEDHKTVKIPLSDMDPAEEGRRPNSVGEEAWEKATTPEVERSMAATYLTSQLTGVDQLGNAKAVRRNNANVKNATGSTPVLGAQKAETSTRRRRRRKDAEEPEQTPVAQTTHRQRRRRSTTISADGSQATVEAASSEAEDVQKPASEAAGQTTPRRRRRRASEGRSKNAAMKDAEKGSGAGSQTADKPTSEKGRSQGRPRPGQKSSGLRVSQENQADEGADEQPSRRRRRRRSRGGSASEKGGSNES